VVVLAVGGISIRCRFYPVYSSIRRTSTDESYSILDRALVPTSQGRKRKASNCILQLSPFENAMALELLISGMERLPLGKLAGVRNEQFDDNEETWSGKEGNGNYYGKTL